MRRPVFSFLLLAGTLGASAALAQSSSPPPNPCQADVARLCPGAQPGHGAIGACLRQNADQLSAECKAHLDERRAHFRAAREACQADVAKLCADVKPGGGRIAACLQQHSSEVSDSCRAQWPTKPGNKL
jgi:hypothetical protein